jgi:hypothetical protein
MRKVVVLTLAGVATVGALYTLVKIPEKAEGRKQRKANG